jgi:hypothetical protein
MRKSPSGMLINPRVVFTFTRQRWSSTTFSSLLTLLIKYISDLSAPIFPYFNSLYISFQSLEVLSLAHNRLTALSSQCLASLGHLTSLSLSHNLLDSLAQLAVSSSPLLEVRISVADPDPPVPHVFGPPHLAQPLPQPPGQPRTASGVLLPTPRGENQCRSGS